MTTITPLDINETFERALKSQLDRMIKDFCEKRSAQLVEEFGKELSGKLKEISARAALEIFSLISMERFGSELRISIQTDKEK